MVSLTFSRPGHCSVSAPPPSPRCSPCPRPPSPHCDHSAPPPRCCSAPRLTPCPSLATENFHRLCGSGLAAELRVTCDHFYLLHQTEASSDQAVYRWRAGPHTAPVPAPHRTNPSQPHKLMMIMVITHSRLKYKSRFLTFTDKMFISAQGSRAALAQYGADTGQHQRGHSTQL